MKKYRHRKKYQKIWEEHNNACIMPGMHIHHIDGNKANNHIDNLMLVTPQEHYDIHLRQGDYGAAQMIASHNIKISNTEIWNLASITMKRTHQRMKEEDPDAYSEWQRQRALGKKRTKKQCENYKKAAQKRISDPSYSKKLSEACKGTRQKRTCPHCGLIGGGGNMFRYHFDNCKHKLGEVICSEH